MKHFFVGPLAATLIACATLPTTAEVVLYSYTGSTANHDSTITAWFQFDRSAMSDLGVAFYEISQHSFQVSGSEVAMNGQYDLFLGGGIGFAATDPGPTNLPVIQSLVIQDSQTHSIIMSDNSGDPDIFVGGTLGTGPPVYSGQWSFVVPEPGSLQLLGMLAGCWLARPGRRGAE